MGYWELEVLTLTLVGIAHPIVLAVASSNINLVPSTNITQSQCILCHTSDARLSKRLERSMGKI